MNPFTPQLEALKGKTVRVVNAAFDDGTPHLIVRTFGKRKGKEPALPFQKPTERIDKTTGEVIPVT